MSRFVRYSVAVLVVLACNACVAADELNFQDKTLKGLTGVGVVAVYSRADKTKDDSMGAAIQIAVEARVRKNGIKVLTEAEGRKKPDDAILYVHVIMLAHSDELRVFSTDVRLMQKVTTAHGVKADATTWYFDGVSSIGRTELKRYVLNRAEFCTDRFCRSYLKANPK